MTLPAFLGRSVTDLVSGGTLSSPIETRNIVVAQGIQFTNADLARAEPYSRMPHGLNEPVAHRDRSWPAALRHRRALPIVVNGPNDFEYTDLVQGVNFVVKVVVTKDAYRAALLTADTHVIYDGHARYGRGPCFGILPVPDVVSATEDWEQGSDPATTGIFRMGFPFIGVPVAEVLHHGYTCDLVDATTHVIATECDPDVRMHVGDFENLPLRRLHSGLAALALDKDPSKRWKTYMAFEDGRLQRHVLLNAGWTGTRSAPADLGATTPMCKVFCHFGCSTMRHNHPILRGSTHKAWTHSGDDRFAFFTTNLSSGPTTARWLFHLFTYPKKNAFMEWGPSIDYALRHTNADLALEGESFRVI